MAKLANDQLLQIGGFPGVFTLRGEAIEVTPLSEPDPEWRYRDKAGHDHFYWSKGEDHYPTLTEIPDTTWCSDCREEHTNYHYECRSCREVIVPGTRQPLHSQYVQGPVSGEARVTIPPGVEPPEEIEFEHDGKVYSLALTSVGRNDGLPSNAEYAITGVREADMVKIENFEPEETEDGLYAKYRVFKEPDEASEHPVDVEALWYSRAIGAGVTQKGRLEEVRVFIFPLKPDTDRHARVALAAYAWSIRDEKPALFEDLMMVLEDLPEDVILGRGY